MLRKIWPIILIVIVLLTWAWILGYRDEKHRQDIIQNHVSSDYGR